MNSRCRLLCDSLIAMLLLSSASMSQTEIRLWPGSAPGALGTDPDKDTPRLYAYLPDSTKRTGCAMVICPGGGYHNIEPFRDDANGAQWFSQQGIAYDIRGCRIPQTLSALRECGRMVVVHGGIVDLR